MVALGFKLSGGHPAVLVETGISKQPRQAAGSDESLLASDLSRSTAAAGSAACVQLCTLNSSLNRCHPSNAYNSKLKTSGHPDSQEGRTWGGGCSGSQTPTSTNPRPHWLKTDKSQKGRDPKLPVVQPQAAEGDCSPQMAWGLQGLTERMPSAMQPCPMLLARLDTPDRAPWPLSPRPEAFSLSAPASLSPGPGHLPPPAPTSL